MNDTPDLTQHDDQGLAEAVATSRTYGLLAEFDQVGCLLGAAEAVRDAGYRQWDCFTPFPVHRLEKAMGIRPTRLPLVVFLAGLAGAALGTGLTVYTMSTSVDAVPTMFQGYPYVISGKPYNSFAAFIPVIFETTILLAAFAAVFGMLLMNRLPRLHHPLFGQEAFRRVTDDRFFLAVEADDEKYDEQALDQMLRRAGALSVDRVEDTD
jgi:hypothetical protein